MCTECCHNLLVFSLLKQQFTTRLSFILREFKHCTPMMALKVMLSVGGMAVGIEPPRRYSVAWNRWQRN